ncbi:MAG: hypothetical protein Kow0077_15110 [Anaerolineae bacterium]
MTAPHLIRRAVPQDARAIAAIKQATWPEENPGAPLDRIAAIIREPDHVVQVAEINGALAGFIDSFVTLSAEGVRRWEIDLLAVHPGYRRRGLGRALVAASFAAGRNFHPALARALIRLDNVASQRAFAANAFTPLPERYRLMIGTPEASENTAPPPDAHLIPVQTLNYAGLWIEGQPTTTDCLSARAICARHGWPVAGAVIRTHQQAAIRAAKEAGFTAVEDFQWWVRPYR